MILFLIQGREHYFSEVVSKLQEDYLFVSDWDTKSVFKHKPDILVSLGEGNIDIYECFSAAKKLKIPTLTINDGIVEWKDVWENPRYGSGGKLLNRQMFFGDKVACHGQQQIRLFESWGMIGKTELVGIPWFDKYFNGSIKKTKNHNTDAKHILIATAKTPGFNDDHMKSLENSLLDLREFFNHYKLWSPIWRVASVLKEKLNLVDMVGVDAQKALSELLIDVDAVVTAPSTLMLESMIYNKPTAILDYYNTPKYIKSAWCISAKIHLEQVLNELTNPPQSKLLFQDMALNDTIQTDGKSAERFVQLILEMIKIGKVSRKNSRELMFPFRILKDSNLFITSPSNYFDVSKLYPEHPFFGKANIDTILDSSMLQYENDLLRRKIDSYKIRHLLISFFKKVNRIISK